MLTRLAVGITLAFGLINSSHALDPRLTEAGIPNDIALGNFRIICDFSHALMDDPIVHPRERGGAHHHFFFGNTRTDAFSTTKSLMSTGGSTCQGQSLNRSAYWIPAVYNSDGQARIPDDINIYYKHESDEPANSLRDLPTGLRMIAGNAMGNSDESTGDVFWRCRSWPYNDNFPNSKGLPSCDAGDKLLMNISFPNCWDGKRLSSKDQSHMAYSRYVYDEQTGRSNSLCPATHPAHLPRITYLFQWNHENESSNAWYLASDRHHGRDAVPGTTLHGDWWNGWKESVVKTWTQECLRESRDCDTGNLGDGTALVREFKAGSGRVSKPAAATGRYCNGRKATIVGTSGDDTLNGTDGQDVIMGFGGDDRINGYGDKDVICAGPGNDIVDGGDGDDEIRAEAGDDLVDGGAGRDRIYGGSGDDTIDGGVDSDTLHGQSGLDIINTGDGHDWAFGGPGDDQLNGSYFTDRLFGQDGDDQLYGVGGSNALYGGSGTDVCESGGEPVIIIKDCP